MDYRAWATRFEITARTAVKSQELVDFINDWTELQVPEEKPDNTYWTIHFDGSKQLEGSGLELFLLPLEVINFAMFYV